MASTFDQFGTDDAEAIAALCLFAPALLGRLEKMATAQALATMTPGDFDESPPADYELWRKEVEAAILRQIRGEPAA
jgi:hypothetical protein